MYLHIETYLSVLQQVKVVAKGDKATSLSNGMMS